MHKAKPVVIASQVLCLMLAVSACTSGDAPGTTDTSGNGSASPSAATPATGASPAGIVGDEVALEVVAENLPYAEVNDSLTYGYFAFPANMVDPLPAVLVVHDRWGLNDDVRATVERLAAGGYIVLGVDLFAGQSAETLSEARELEIGVVEDRATAQENIKQAIEFVRMSSAPPSVSIVGFGFGGGWALNSAMDLPEELGAAISYYGQVPTDDSEIESLDVPYLGFFSENDRAVPIASARAFSEKASAMSKDVEIRTFADARRGFAEESGDSFDANASQAAWTHMLRFLDARVSTTP